MADYLEIPWQKLSEDAFQGMLEELVSRDGTDYGERELSQEEKNRPTAGGIKKWPGVYRLLRRDRELVYFAAPPLSRVLIFRAMPPQYLARLPAYRVE